jgi:hypothetical protein
LPARSGPSLLFTQAATRRRLFRWAGYPILGLGTFVLCAQWTFPYGRVRDRLVAVVGAHDGGRLARAWLPGRFGIDELKWSRQWTFDRVAVRTGISAALAGRIDVSFDASLHGRRVTGTVREDAAGTTLEVAADGVRARIIVPIGRPDLASGTIEVACDACAAPRRVVVIDGIACVSPADLDLAGELPFASIDCSPTPVAMEAPVASAPPTQPMTGQRVLPTPLRPGDIGDGGGRPISDSELPAPPPPKEEAVVQPLVREY